MKCILIRRIIDGILIVTILERRCLAVTVGDASNQYLRSKVALILEILVILSLVRYLIIRLKLVQSFALYVHLWNFHAEYAATDCCCFNSAT